MTVVSFSMAYRSFQGGSGRLDTRLDTPHSINRRHPDSCLAQWLTPRHIVVVAETGDIGPVAFTASFAYSDRVCYSGIGEFSVYVRRDYRGRVVLAALIEAATARGMHKLTSRVF